METTERLTRLGEPAPDRKNEEYCEAESSLETADMELFAPPHPPPPPPAVRMRPDDIVEISPTDNLCLQIWAREAMRVTSGAVGVQRDTSYQWASRGVASREASGGEVQSQASASIAQGGPSVFCSKIEGAAMAMWLL